MIPNELPAVERDELVETARQWYPVVAAILSSLLNFIAFMIGVKWDGQKIWQVGIIAILGTAVVSFFTIYILVKLSIVGRTMDFSILKSEDEYDIRNPREAVYRRTITCRLNKELQFLVIEPPSVDGRVGEFIAYDRGNPHRQYNVSIQREAWRTVLWINLGYVHAKGSVIENLCIETVLEDSFMRTQEGVKVTTDVGQQECKIRVFLPKENPPSLTEWFIVFRRNPKPLYHDEVEVYQKDGRFVIEKDFSYYLRKSRGGLALECVLSWKWDIPDLEELQRDR